MPARKTGRRFSVVLSLPLLLNSPSMAAPAFDRLVVFGDSLSDGGNAGHFSNGPVWVEYLAERLALSLRPSNVSGLNFAVGGARLDPRSGPNSLRAQAEAYLRSDHVSSTTLYIVYGGANDVLAAIGNPEADKMISVAVTAMQGILKILAEKGARDVLVPNLPDVSIAPAVRSRGSQAVQEATKLTERFNRLLEQTLMQMTSIRVYRLDVNGMAEQIRKNPSSFGFVDIATPCDRLPTCDGYLFWDDVHPTTRAHERLAHAAFQAIAQP